MSTSQPLLSPALIVVCVVMAIAAAGICRFVLRQSPWAVPSAAARAALQLAAVATVLAAAMSRLWSSLLVMVVMFLVAAVVAARRSQAEYGSALLAFALATGMLAVIPLLLATRVIPLAGVAMVPIFGIVLGGTMTAVSVAARRALDELTLRAGEVEAAMTLGFTDRDARMEILDRPLADALLPNLDQARTAGLVTLPGAFVGVLLATGSAPQAAAVQVLVLVSLLLSQACGVAVAGELIARGRVSRALSR